MQVFHSIDQLSKYLHKKPSLHSVGFVPTMGALHAGHLALVKKAVEQNDITVVSIFVNPTQFDQQEDLKKYPRTLEADVALLRTVGCDLVFAPSTTEIYDESVIAQHFDFDGLEKEMEGKHRHGHFNGVGTIVKRLFEIVTPDRAYFGEKDFQQLQIIRKLVEQCNLTIQIVGCPIHREEDGLAMSSRNARLSPASRLAAPFIFKTLKEAKKQFQTHSISTVESWVNEQFKINEQLSLEYFEIANEQTLKKAQRKTKGTKYRAFIAAYAGKIRLIDNIALN